MKRARLSRVVVAVVLILVSGCCGNPSAPSPWTGQVQIAGVVRDFRSDVVIAGAHVAFNQDTVAGPSGAATTSTTDASGTYSLTVPGDHQYFVSIDGEAVTGVMLKDRTYRGDFYAHGRGCEARYGMVIDSQTRIPVIGATVQIASSTAMTDQTGWFRLSLGCDNGNPFPGCIGSGTSIATVMHTAHSTGSFVVGRGVCFVERVDWELLPR